MVGFLFPAMAVSAILHISASFRVLSDVPGRSPVFSFYASISEQLGVSPEILPIVGIYTICLMMVFPERTPFRLKIVHVEVKIPWEFMDQLDLYLRYEVSK